MDSIVAISFNIFKANFIEHGMGILNELANTAWDAADILFGLQEVGLWEPGELCIINKLYLCCTALGSDCAIILPKQWKPIRDTRYGKRYAIVAVGDWIFVSAHICWDGDSTEAKEQLVQINCCISSSCAANTSIAFEIVLLCDANTSLSESLSTYADEFDGTLELTGQHVLYGNHCKVDRQTFEAFLSGLRTRALNTWSSGDAGGGNLGDSRVTWCRKGNVNFVFSN